MAEDKTTIGHVTSQALSAISNLKTLSASLLEARTRLQRKSYQTKEEIYAAISRQLEALRDREIWLLTQVDTITQLKEEEIQGRLTAATEGLVLLQEKLASLQKHPDQSLCDLTETIQRLCDMEDIPMEDPDLSFVAKGDKLRRKIHNFGSVSSANKRPRLDKYSACMTPADLPSLMKGLGLADPGELFAIFNESRPTSYWLHEGATSQASWHTTTPLSTPFGTDLVLSQWLVGDDNPQEESTNEDDPVYSRDESDNDTSRGVQERMAAILSSPMEMWLCREEDQQSSCFTLDQTTSFVPDDCQDWLMVESVEEETPSQCACIASGDKPMDMDIENLASLLCMQSHQPQPKNSDLSSWLVKKEHQNEERPPISSVCRANELCGSFSECVCDENCLGEGFGVSGNKNSLWLVESKESSRDVSWRFDKEFSVSDWLACNDGKNLSQSDCEKERDPLHGGCFQDEGVSECLSLNSFHKRDGFPSADDDDLEKDVSVVKVVEEFHGSMTKTSDWLEVSEKEDDDEIWLCKKDPLRGGEDSNKWLFEDGKSEKPVESSHFSSLEMKSQEHMFSSTAEKQSLREWLVSE